MSQMEGFGNDDVEVRKFVLDALGKKQTATIDVAEAVTSGSIKRTIEGASTVTIELADFTGDLRNAQALRAEEGVLQAVDVKLDGLWWRLVKLSKSQSMLTLTFEELEVARLRSKHGPRKANRASVTRAQFVKALVTSVRKQKIPFYCPELTKEQPVGAVKAPKKKSRADKDKDRQPGFAKNVHLRGAQGILSPEQLKNADRAFSVAASLKASDKVMMTLAVACITEAPDFKNPTGGEGSSSGILQVTAETSRTTGVAPRNIEQAVAYFLKKGYWGKGGAIALARQNPKWTPGQIAQNVQGSKYPSRYDKYRGQARSIVNAWSGVGSGGRVSYQTKKPYQFKVDKKETYWDAIQKLAKEVNWRAFVVSGTFYYISEEDLFKSRPLAIISEDADGVEWIDWDWDSGKRVNTAVISCRVDRWAAPPGSMVTLKSEGPANGKWLVETVERDVFTPTATITLKKPLKELAEPAPETATHSGSWPADSGPSSRKQVSGGKKQGRTAAEALLSAARSIQKHKYPYVLGGGHAHIGHPDRGTGRDPGIGYDCSGGVAAALYAVGLTPSSWSSGVPASGGMASSYGSPGQGRYITVWANGAHVFILIKLDGRTYHCGTGYTLPGGGFGVQSYIHSTGGFTPRHPEGG